MNEERQEQSTVVDSNEPQPSSKAPPQKNLILTLVLSIFLTAVLVGAGVYFWQKSENKKKITSLEERIASLEEDSDKTKAEASPIPDPTANWETYRNEEHGIRFQYPSDWEESSVSKESWNDRLFLLTLNKKDSSQEVIAPGDNKVPANYWITFTVLSNPQELTAMEFYLDGVPLKRRPSMEEKTERVSLDGLEGIKYSEGSAPSSGAQTVVTVARGKKIYKFSYGAMAQQETHEKFMSTFNSILSSFEFID